MHPYHFSVCHSKSAVSRYHFLHSLLPILVRRCRRNLLLCHHLHFNGSPPFSIALHFAPPSQLLTRPEQLQGTFYYLFLFTALESFRQKFGGGGCSLSCEIKHSCQFYVHLQFLLTCLPRKLHAKTQEKENGNPLLFKLLDVRRQKIDIMRPCLKDYFV